MAGDERPSEPAYEIFSIKHTF